MDRLSYTDVFVPGGFPRHTYNPRLQLRLEEKVRQVLENLCKLVIVTGHTKSGKTVLVRSVLGASNPVLVDGGPVASEEDFWASVIDQIGAFQETGQAREHATGQQLSATGRAGANFLVAKGEAEVGGQLSFSQAATATRLRSVSSKQAALSGLAEARRPLVIDDFHYLPLSIQGNIVRALKRLIFDGLPVVIIAIPHRRYDAVKVEREMTGRILPVDIPAWDSHELTFIPSAGFPLLDSTMSTIQTEQLATESIGSPHLMQEFCRASCRAHGITDSFDGQSADLDQAALRAVFSSTAETIGRPIFEKLARGPRQHGDRMPRELKNGETVDIYGLVLQALAHIRPGLVTLEYEELRAAIREVAARDVPQRHEVSRVLKHMSDIAATDRSSTPVIDFDESDGRLHVTDPFFAFYLRWGSLD
jgi:hypothetical protein